MQGLFWTTLVNIQLQKLLLVVEALHNGTHPKLVIEVLQSSESIRLSFGVIRPYTMKIMGLDPVCNSCTLGRHPQSGVMTLHEVIQANKCILLVNSTRILSRKNPELVTDDDNHMKNSLMFKDQYFTFNSTCREEGDNNFVDEMCIATCYQIH